MRVTLPFLPCVPLLLATLVTAQNNNGNITCADGLYMIVARGTTEPVGPGSMGTLAEDVADRVRDSEVVGLDYPATLSDPAYVESVIDGGRAIKDAVENYHDACPDGKIAVLGYSQGAQVSLNGLCGGGGDAFEDDLTPVARSVIESSVIAIVLFGDPSHVENATYNEGTADKNGIFARPNMTDCEAISSLIRSYCDEGDVYCDRGDDDDVHGEYIEHYGEEVVDFIVSRFDEVSDSSTTSSSTSVATTTSEASTSGTANPTPTTNDGAPTGTETEAEEPTDTDSGVAGTRGTGSLWCVSLAAVVAWQLL